MIHVVSGILFGDDENQPREWCLLAKRPRCNLRPELWELPGGKIEDNESHDQALRREWKEELGVTLSFVDPRPIAIATLNLEQRIVIYLYEVFVDDLSLPIVPVEHTEILWASPLFAVKSLPCSPGLYLHYAEIEAWPATRSPMETPESAPEPVTADWRRCRECIARCDQVEDAERRTPCPHHGTPWMTRSMRTSTHPERA